MDKISFYGKDSKTEQTYDGELRAYLQYKIVCTPDPIRSIPIDGRVYSLMIVKIASYGESECCFMYDVARNAEKAVRILDTMLTYTVTPCSATEVLEEII